MRCIRVIIFLLIINFVSFAQSNEEWFPANLNIQPFTAHFLEAKTGFQYLFDLKNVQINIGTSHDVIHFLNDDNTISIGADFFTYTRARKEANFKFPVETIDYLFGINAGYKKTDCKNEWGIRIRFSHISAHLVDGLFDGDSSNWKNNREPFVYSREFFELIAYYKIYNVRFYAGVTYNIHIIPDEIKNEEYQFGFDYYLTTLNIKSFTPFAAYNFKLTGIDKYTGHNIIAAGIKFGNPSSRGFSIFFSYVSGKSVHGEFYDISENYSSIGINLDI